MSIAESSPRAYRTSLYRLLVSWQQTDWPHWCSDTQPACPALPAARTRSVSFTFQFLPQDRHALKWQTYNVMYVCVIFVLVGSNDIDITRDVESFVSLKLMVTYKYYFLPSVSGLCQWLFASKKIFNFENASSDYLLCWNAHTSISC